MNRETIQQQIHQVLLDNLPDVTAEKLSTDAELFSLGLNSLNAVSMVLGLEDAFGFQFELDELSFDRFRAVSDLVELVTRKLELGQ